MENRVDMITLDELHMLTEPHQQPCLSIFVPMEKAGKETRQNAIRFKNVLNQAKEQLRAQGLDEAATREMLQPYSKMEEDALFWQHQGHGLAVFRSLDANRVYKLPMPCEERVLVSDHFYLKPLIPLLSNNGRYYVLALSKHTARLFQGSRFEIHELELPEDTPKSIEEVVAEDDPEKQVQLRTNVPRGRGNYQAPVYHGHDDADERVNILRYFLEVDRGVTDVLKQEQAPLILMGVDYMRAYYHDRNMYQNLLEQGADGNPDTLSPETIHDQVWPIVEPVLLQDQQAAIERYPEAQARALASDDLHTILTAAASGQIDTLMIATDNEQWGLFDPHANSVEYHETYQTGDDDLLDVAAIHTLLNSGSVYMVEPDNVPGTGVAAALLRYPATQTASARVNTS